MKTAETRFAFAANIAANARTVRHWAGQRALPFTAILDFGIVTDSVLPGQYLRHIGEQAASRDHLGIRLMLQDVALLQRLAAAWASPVLKTMVLALPQGVSEEALATARQIAGQVFLEIYSVETALAANRFQPDGFVIRGNEAGGLCADTSNPTLLRSLRRHLSQPIWVYGGVGPESALAYAVGGADGVILSDALLLLPELADDLKAQERRALKAGVRTQAVDIGQGLQVRISEACPELIERIRALGLRHDRRTEEEAHHPDTRLAETLSILASYPGAARGLLGEENGWAAEVGKQFASIEKVLDSLRQDLAGHLESLARHYPLGAGSALAGELKVEFPILQGPMTHVSDRPAFLAEVARNGAVPFAALGLCKGAEVETLLRETRAAMNGKPWGVGIIGFAPKALQDEQFELIGKHKPDLAIVAGGRPAHYHSLRALGVIPFLHIPVPSMIAGFFKDGVRHFVFEGRGCGGHIGPVNSYPLWQAALIEFQQLAAQGEDLSGVRIAWAGGIYDGQSAAMAAAFCTPLSVHGVQFCFVVGTAYLFTREIVDSAALTPVFQRVALESDRTVILEGGGGHAIRCARTPIAARFAGVKAALLDRGTPPQELQAQLDKLNVGRLRLAAKGVKRSGLSDDCGALAACADGEQVNEGLFMLGEVATLMDGVFGMAELHRAICEDAQKLVYRTKPMAGPSPQTQPRAVGGQPTDVAIIGMATLVPGADDLDAFWRNVLTKAYCIQEVPEERWSPAVNYHPDPDHKDTTYSKMGGFLGEIPINGMQYGIPPGSMPHVEPAQLLALEAVNQALIDAGYARREFDREKTSVVFGFAGGGDLLLAYSARAIFKEYLARARDIPEKIREEVLASVNAVLPEWNEDAFPGILGNIIAGRVANRFNLNGLNFTLDAACASSMAALQVACMELAYGTTRTAIVGGVDASQHPFGYTCFSKTKALSVTGRARPFAPDTDGIVLGEGVGVVVLKRLAEAIADNDRIYAVIKGIGGASDGKGSGMTVPVTRGQQLAIGRAYELAGFKTDTVDLIEAHGTGTPLGDRVELETLHAVLQQHSAVQPCAIGSIKSSIGHTKGAAGILGVIKTALALYHKVLPSHIPLEAVHPAVSNPATRLYVNLETRPWFRRSARRPRRAGASAFGFGGTNFHAVLEEFDHRAPGSADLPSALWPSELFLFGASDAAALVKRIDATLDGLDRSDASLARLAWTHFQNQAISGAMPLRLAVRADSIAQLKARLTQGKALLENHEAGGHPAQPAIFTADGLWGTRHAPAPEPVAALFPGQGAQKPDMLRELALVFPVVRECIEQANALLADDFFPAARNVLTDFIYPPTFQEADARKAATRALTQTTVAQPALAAVEMALYCLLMQFNVRIAMAAGHSFGELTALWAAGSLTDRQLLTLAARRGRCMAQSSTVPTGMTAVQIQREALEATVAATPGISIANHNTPKQVVVSGSIEALEAFETHCREKKWSYKRLAVSQGFHSPYMADAEVQWRKALDEEAFAAPRFPVYANLTAQAYGPGSREIAETLGRHLRQGVHFVGEIEAMHAAGAHTFLEIGPGATLTRFVGAILGDRPHRAIAVQPREGQAGVEMLLDSLAALFVLGHDIDLQPAFQCRRIGPQRSQPVPSATVFMVNGGRAKPTVALKSKPNPAVPASRWAAWTQPAPASAAPASDAPASDTVAAVQAALPVRSQNPPAAQPPPRPAQRPATVGAAAVLRPMGAAAIIGNEQEKLNQMKHFQKSMNLFLEAQERHHQQRLAMLEKMWQVHQQLLQGLFGAMPSAASPAMPVPPEPPAWSQPATPDAIFEPAPKITPAPAFAGQGVRPSAPVADAGTAAAPPVAPPVQTASLPATVDYQALLFEIISERTQYPVDMLAPEQQIEGDLGIDSIKRVEIISMLQGTHPSLADIANEKYFEDLAQLKTLGDVVRWIQDRFGAPTPAPEAPTQIGSAGGPTAAPVPRAPSVAGGPVDYQALLFEIISERTQYPVDMLAPEQEIEGDLGIDSIKRVEIISMLQGTHPSLADIGNEKYFEDLAQLKTLGDVVRWIQTRFGAPTPAPEAPTESGPAGGPAPRASSAADGPVDYQALLFAVISERTQYPVDMLAPEQEIEGDLGIDSIKRVEIISLLQGTHPSLADIGNEKYFEDLAQLKTLGDVVRWIEKHFGSAAPEVAAAPASAPDSAPERVAGDAPIFRRYLLQLVERPIESGAPRALDGALVILDGGHALGLQLQSAAEKMGMRCVRVVKGADAEAAPAGCVHLDYSEETAYEACYHRIKAAHGTPAGVINLLALGKNTHVAVRKALLHTFLWARTMGADKQWLPSTDKRSFWFSVSGMGGDFGLNKTMNFTACQNGLHGITKCLFHEWPGLQARTIDIHPEGNLEKLARGLLDECRTGTVTLQEVGFPNHIRHELALVERPAEPEPPQPRWHRESVFLITGGAKGITADVAALLAERYAPTLILTGRTLLPERPPQDLAAFTARAALGAQDPKRLKSEIIEALKASGQPVAPSLVNERFNAVMQEYKVRQTLARLEGLGARVFYHACDCTDDPAFSRLIARIYQQHGTIDGVIHAAGYLRDGLITQKRLEHFKQVLDTKVEGANILVRELDFQKLDFIVFFSSVAGRFGNQGQADYAAANEILNKMAVNLNQWWPGKATAINWGPWEGEGMVSDQVKKQFEQLGIHLIPRDVGVQMLHAEIVQADRPAEVVLFGARDAERRLPVVQLAPEPPGLPFAALMQPIDHGARWRLDLDQTAPYLNDHRINGTAVLPAAVAMEIMAQAAMIAQPGYRFKGLRDFQLVKGITLAASSRTAVTVAAQKASNGTPHTVRVQVRLATPEQAQDCNYTATILLTNEKNGSVPTFANSTHSRRFELPLEQVYEQRLFHAGVFRGIKSIESFEIADLHNNGIRGRIETSTPERILGAHARGDWLIDPIVFDSAYQLALLWTQECYDMMALLGDVKNYVQYRPYRGGVIICEVAVKLAQFPKILLDFHFSDPAGGLYAKATDVAAIMKKDLNLAGPGHIRRDAAIRA